MYSRWFCFVVGLVVYMDYLQTSHIAEKGYKLGTKKELSIINIKWMVLFFVDLGSLKSYDVT